MVNTYKLSEFDFSGKRVRRNGKVLSKFDLSCIIGRLEPYSCYSIYPDAYPYSDYVDKLMGLLYDKFFSSNGFEPVTGELLTVVVREII